MVLAGQETLVCNRTSKNFFATSDVTSKDLLEYDDADHCILNDREHWPLVVREVVNWQNTR